MTYPQLADDAVQVALLAPGRHANLAAGIVVQHFGLTLAAAEALLTFGRGVIAPRVHPAEARKAIALLTAMGVHVAIRPVDAQAEPEYVDLALRATDDAVADLTQALARLGFGEVRDFGGPSGHVLTGVTRNRAEAVAAALRAIPGVQATLSAQNNARYDLFAPVAGWNVDLGALRRHLVHLGCADAGLGAVLASGLDRRMLSHILAKFGSLGLLGVDQAFQRFDLTLIGPGRLTAQEFHDFLATRAKFGGHLRMDIAAGRGVRIETGLSRAATVQFLSDYATIGIPARADLIRV